MFRRKEGQKTDRSRREHLDRSTGNRRRNRRISSSSSALFDANNETNEDKNEEKTTSETIAGTTKTSRVVDFVAAWDVLSGRLSESSMLRSEEDESDDDRELELAVAGNAPRGFSAGDTEVTTDATHSFG